MNDINIFLIRHGESFGNLSNDTIGQAAGTELTPKGIEQAQKLGQRLSNLPTPDFVATSSYKRAMDTCSIVSDVSKWNVKPDITDILVEYNPGDWMGMKRSEMYKNPKNLQDITYKNMGFKFPGVGGESYHRVERRAATYIEDAIIYNEDILSLAEKKEVNTVLFSHGMTIKAALHYAMGFDSSFMWKVRIGNTSISHLVWNDKGWFLDSINDCGHLL